MANYSLVRAAIIDLDGTMVDTFGDFVVALNCMLSDLHLPSVGRPDVVKMVGKGSEHLLRSTLIQQAPGLGAQGVELLLPRAMAAYQRHYFRINGLHSHVYDGVKQGLSYMRSRGWKLACVTNKPSAFAEPLLAAKALDGFFSVVFGGDAFAQKKPDPMPLLRACEALGTSPECTLMVGDSCNDAVAARAAGCPVWLVTYGYNHGQAVTSVDADGYLDSLADCERQFGG